VYCPYCSKEFNIMIQLLGYHMVEKEMKKRADDNSKDE